LAYNQRRANGFLFTAITPDDIARERVVLCLRYPPGGVIECPESSDDDDRLKEFWNKVKLFSAEFDPKKG